MFNLSHHIQQIQSSPTLALNETARQLHASGAAVINLGIGEPLNPCPEAAIRMARAKLESGQVKYSPVSGDSTFKEAVQKYTVDLYGRTPKLENITVTVGAKQALFNLFQVLLDPGDEVLIFTPYWVSYPEMIKLARGVPVKVATNEAFIPDMESILEAITGKTKAILLNSPNNPSAAIYPPELVAALVDLCESRKIYLIMDDIYNQLVFEPGEWVPGYVFTSHPINKSHLVVVNGISKTYGMTGFRIGWAIGATPVIRAMNKIQSHSTSGVSILLQEAALGALTGGAETVRELQTLIRTNRDILVRELRKIKGLRIQEPAGTFYCFPDLQEISGDSEKLANLLLEKAYVATVPGSAFGADGFLRLSYAGSTEEIIEGAARIRWALDPDSPPDIVIAGETHRRTWEIDRL